MLQRLHCSVSSSDDIVASLYRQSDIQLQIAEILPKDFGDITRYKLGQFIAQNPNFLNNLEKIIHPAVEKRHLWDINQARLDKKSITVLEIPLLFELNWQNKCDQILLVTCQPHLQYQRVMARSGMTDEKFKAFQARQWPEAQKKKLADFVLDTSYGRLHTFQQLKQLLKRYCSDKN